MELEVSDLILVSHMDFDFCMTTQTNTNTCRLRSFYSQWIT